MSDFESYTAAPPAPSGTPSAEERQWGLFGHLSSLAGLFTGGIGNIVGPLIMALAALSAIGRGHRAIWMNHRYHFTTWRWGRWALILLSIGLVLKVALPA